MHRVLSLVTMHRFFNIILGFSFAFLLSSCSIRFNHEWKQALAAQSGKTPSDITGLWSGSWKSDANGHSGDLRCIVTPIDAQSGACRFHYHATWMKTLSTTYDVTHVVKRTGDGFVFSGDQELSGAGSGLYHYEGRATPMEFRSTFRSVSDHGVFEMKRP